MNAHHDPTNLCNKKYKVYKIITSGPCQRGKDEHTAAQSYLLQVIGAQPNILEHERDECRAQPGNS